MKLYSIVAALFVSSVIAADGNSVASKINALESTTKKLNSDVQMYFGGIFGVSTALQVQVDTINSYYATNDIINEANASGAFDAAGSKAVVAAAKSLSGTVKTTLANVQGKASTFADLGPLVLAGLYQLRQSSANFALALAPKLQPSDINEGFGYYQTVDNSFKSAILAYGGKAP